MEGDFYVYFVCLVTLVVAWAFLYRQIATFRYPTIPVVFFFFQTLTISMGAPYIYTAISHGTAHGYLISTLTASMLFPVGCWATNRLLVFDARTETGAYLSDPLRLGAKETSWPVLWCIFFLVCSSVSALYLSKLSAIPLVEVLREDISQGELRDLRDQATASFGGKFHWYRFAFQTLLPVATLSALLLMRSTGKLLWRLLFLFSAPFAAFMLLSTGQKAPVTMFMISLTVAYVWTCDPRKAFRILATGALAALGMIVLIYFVFFLRSSSQDVNIADKLTRMIGRRLFLGQTYPLYMLFATFPGMHDFLWGQSLPNPAGVLPFKPFPLPFYVYDLIAPIAPVRGSAPTVYYGEVYANFGWGVMLASQVLIGSVLQFTHILFVRGSKDVLHLALMISLAFLFQKASGTGLGVIAIPLALFVMIGVFLRFGLFVLDRMQPLERWLHLKPNEPS